MRTIKLKYLQALRIFMVRTGVKVSDAMSVTPISISSEKSVFFATQFMMKKRVGSLLVIEDDVLQGIFTERDLVRLISKGLDPKDLLISEVMTKHPKTAEPDHDLSEAVHYMHKHKIRRLPVQFKEKVVGMLTFKDVIRVQPAMFEILLGRGYLTTAEGEEDYVEGNCGVCDNFAQLYDRDSQYICAECLGQRGESVS